MGKGISAALPKNLRVWLLCIAGIVMLAALLGSGVGGVRSQTPDESESSPTPGPALTEKSAKYVCDLAEDKFKKDQSGRVTELLKSVGKEECPELAKAAEVIIEADKVRETDKNIEAAKSSWIEGWGKAWSEFAKAYAVPLGNLMLVALGMGLACFVIARLLILTPLFNDLRSSKSDAATTAGAAGGCCWWLVRAWLLQGYWSN